MDKYSYFSPVCLKTKADLAHYMCGNSDMHPAICNIYDNIISYLEGSILENRAGDQVPDSVTIARAKKLLKFTCNLHNLALNTDSEEHTAYLHTTILKMAYAMETKNHIKF